MAFGVFHPKAIYFIKTYLKNSIIQIYFLKYLLLFILKTRTLLLCISILPRKRRSCKYPSYLKNEARSCSTLIQPEPSQRSTTDGSAGARSSGQEGGTTCFPPCLLTSSSELVSWAHSISVRKYLVFINLLTGGPCSISPCRPSPPEVYARGVFAGTYHRSR